GQKTIIIGSNAEKIKEVGRSARVDLEKLLYTKVFLQLWVKVKSNWSDNERALKSLGFNSFD
nr:KH domain-containing protein [Gammaproteobacteria bacterium]